MSSQVADKIRIPAALWEGLKRVGVAPADVIGRARIPVSAVRDGAPVSTRQFFAIWEALAEVADDPAIGLRIATELEAVLMPPSFLAAYHARDFRDALRRVARFKRLCAPEDVLIVEGEDQCEVVVEWPHDEGRGVPSPLVDATFASLLELGRRGTAGPLTPRAVELARVENAKGAYEHYYGCRVRYGAARNCLMFQLADLDKRFVTYNAELLEILVPELDRRLEELSHRASLPDQVKWVLRRRLTAGRPDIRSVATELAMSERSLQRALTDEGMTFQGLLSETRHQLALEYLADPRLAIIEVAYMLGYEDQNSFFRAFRQWEDLTPSAWRASRAGRSERLVNREEGVR
jgi:AraC-like DNA-binding protein